MGAGNISSGADSSGADSSGAENPDDASSAGGADRRPLGFWLRVVDARLTRDLHVLLEADGLDRRDWMILNAIAGTVDRGPLAARLERGGRRLRALVDRGWVTGTPGAWALTDEGRAAFDRIGAKVADFRARVAGAVSPEDFATTLATLEAIAAELGESDDESGAFGRGRRGGRGRGRGFGWGAGPRGFGPGYGRGFGPGYDGGEHGEGDGERHPGHHPGHGHHPHHGHEGHGCRHGGPEFAHHGATESGHHGAPESGHRHGRGHSHDRGSEAAVPATPTTEV